MEKVVVINQTMEGTFFVEGTASIVRRYPSGYADVRFKSSGAVYRRFVDPDAQDDPQAFVDELNEASRGARSKAS